MKSRLRKYKNLARSVYRRRTDEQQCCYDSQDGKELGWAVANTFPVAAMESARVAYGGIAATVT